MAIPISRQKTIGTLVPISSLLSSKQNKNDRATFDTCIPFLDWLHKTRQSAWEFLPLHETQLEIGSNFKHVPSPYKTYGVGIDPKYLPKSFREIPTNKEKKDFIDQNNDWILDYAFFCALRDYFKTDDWRLWDRDLKNRKKRCLNFWNEKLKEEIDRHIIVQWQADKSYERVKYQAKKLGILLVGDFPFYLSIQSPLVWANQDVFQIGKDGAMRYVSGVPFVPTVHFGRQVWGHPLYNWGSKEYIGKIVSFWKMRMSYQLKLYDLIRFDHARGFFEYGMMDPENEKNDLFQKGPGAAVFEELVRFASGIGLSIFAEDSGEDLNELRKSLHKLKIPGIKILRFALNEKLDKLDIKHADISSYPKNSVSYSTTHDTETLLGYLENMTFPQKKKLAAASKVTYSSDNLEFAKRLRSAILKSPAGTVIIPIQDWLLTRERINIPGTEVPVNDPNWSYRLKIPIENLPTEF